MRIKLIVKIVCFFPVNHSHFCWLVFLGIGNYSLRMMVGLFSLVASFILIMIADNGRDILINFTAVEFISYLDDAIFILGAVTEVFILRASSRYENSRYVSTTFPDYVCLLFVFYSLGTWGYLGDAVNNKARQICKAKYLDPFFGA